MGIGDPAVDLSIASGALPATARGMFWEACGAVSDAVLRRARHFALAHTISLLCYAVDIDDQDLRDEAALALQYGLEA